MKPLTLDQAILRLHTLRKQIGGNAQFSSALLGGESFVIVAGSPMDGLTLIGPFSDHGSAVWHAEDTIKQEWWITKLETPDGT